MNNLQHGHVSPEDTVPCRVQYQQRKSTDIGWGIANILTYIAFLSTGLFVVSRSSPRHQSLSNNARGLSDYYMDDAASCCAKTSSAGYICTLYENTLNDNGDRRLAAGNSTFDGDEGIFDVFIEAPGIIVGLLSVVLAVSILWVVLLRFFAKPIVIFVEAVKIGLMITLGVYQEDSGGRVFCFIVAFLMLGYAIWQRKTILFAAEIITHSTISMKENPSILFGSLFIKLLYAGNAAVFVLFFSKSFDVVDIVLIEETFCDFSYPAYVQRISIFWGLSYLWTILLLGQMRLSVIATIVGSWHFHPEDKPSVFKAIANIVPSFGTLSVSSLIATVADKVNRMMSGESWLSPTIFMTWPLECFMCIFGSCIHTLVKMLTNYAVVLHCFTGENFIGSARNSFNILSRHFKGGFVTEITSRALFTLAAYAFSFCVALITWVWIDAEFNAESLPSNSESFMWILYLLIMLFTIYFPVLGLYLIILANKILRDWERASMNDSLSNGTDPLNSNHVWIPPLAAGFVGCISMMFFTFVSNIFLDIITTLFLCFAIDKDNNVDLGGKEFDTLVSQMPDYIGEDFTYVEEDPETPQTQGHPVAIPVKAY